MAYGNCIAGRRVERGLELLVVWVLSTSAIGLAAALTGHFLAPQILIGSLLITAGYGWLTRGVRHDTEALPDWRHLALLVLVCLFFRLPGYHYVLGGQDEGIYVNAANHILRSGGVVVQDLPLQRLAGTPLAKTYLEENRGAYYLPGIYSFDNSSPRLEFQFYHLFPVWMALFAGIFSIPAEIYALTLFSLLSVIFMYRLALGLSGSPKAALVAGLFLALNPLHAFFSKFPVTEIEALAFSLMGFSYLVDLRRQQSRRDGTRLLWLSALSFAGLFTTRISGFTYLPFIVAVAIASSIGDQDRAMRRSMVLWSVIVTALYALSVRYGLHWSRTYSRDIYRMSFEHLFGSHWHQGLVASASVILGGWLLIGLASRSERWRVMLANQWLERARKYLGLIVLLCLIAGLVKIYQLGWTNRYLHNGLGTQWHLARMGWSSVEATGLFALLVYLGPLFPAGVVVLMSRRQDPPAEFLRFFVSGFLVFAVLLQWAVPYGPYYTRYFLSEVVPYLGLLFIVVWWQMRRGAWKTVTGCLVGASLLYMGYASSAQLGKTENDQLYSALEQLLSPVDSGDVVLMTSLQPGWPGVTQLKTPIVYTFGLSAISVSDASLNNHAYIAGIDAHYDDVFLVSSTPVAPQGFESVGSTRIKIFAYDHSFLYPDDFGPVAQKRLYLYRLTRPVLPMRQIGYFNASGAWGGFLADGWSVPENFGTWTSGKHARIVIDNRQLPHPSGGLRLHFEANLLVTAKHPRQRVTVFLDGRVMSSSDVVYPRTSLGFNVDISPELLEAERKLRIDFDLPDAVSPRSVGLGNDGRVLALGLKSVEALPMPPAPSKDEAR
ncbi:hypothetical protein ATSB10_36240 [Dyella thiooxydans]|uniref:ArnT-like N-terminal domain-containing protein n=1 Tax=Dyella thiooxydans TaxID=445710 RepID=A0A160N5U5_9GAMM|nr:phospholipid carrier-dependent glycosyltransferase [Dyella thiooxydans]AND71078.1 hypothetical protein ATSB10_36240 [Dyella thiooxydans]